MMRSAYLWPRAPQRLLEGDCFPVPQGGRPGRAHDRRRTGGRDPVRADRRADPRVQRGRRPVARARRRRDVRARVPLVGEQRGGLRGRSDLPAAAGARERSAASLRPRGSLDAAGAALPAPAVPARALARRRLAVRRGRPAAARERLQRARGGAGGRRLRDRDGGAPPPPPAAAPAEARDRAGDHRRADGAAVRALLAHARDLAGSAALLVPAPARGVPARRGHLSGLGGADARAGRGARSPRVAARASRIPASPCCARALCASGCRRRRSRCPGAACCRHRCSP